MLLPLPLLFFLAPLAAFSAPAPSTSSSDLNWGSTGAPDFPNRVLLIRHGEKPRDKSEGLNELGKKRAQCLRKVFGQKGKHNIGLIMAQSYNPRTQKRIRPYLTVKPVAKDLGLEVNLDCESADAACVRRVVREYVKTSDKDVLICWKHSNIPILARALGSRTKVEYPDDRFDIMWIMKHKKIISKESEKCEGLDDHRKLRHGSDPDLEIGEGLEEEEYEGEEDDLDLDLDWIIENAREEQLLLLGSEN